jgi:thioredoxin-dependent peroxiredoxin
MAVRLGDEAPDIPRRVRFGLTSGRAVRRPSCSSHPEDFTPVCTTELGRAAQLKAEFDKRNTKIIGLSGDPVESHVP